MSRKKIIAGNWKMNVKPSETAALVKAIAEATAAYADKVEIVCCTPAIDVLEAVAAAKGTKIGVGTENCHWEDHGAFTGEISTGMIVDTGATYVITGHSERRQYFGETDETVNKRTTAAIKAGLTCMMCVGETLDEREADLVNEVIGRQLKVGLKGLTAHGMPQSSCAHSFAAASSAYPRFEAMRTKIFLSSSRTAAISGRTWSKRWRIKSCV